MLFSFSPMVGVLRDPVKNDHKQGGLQQEIYLVTVVDARSLKSGCRQDQTLSKGLSGRIFPCLFPLLVAPEDPWLVAASLQSLHHLHTTFSSSLCHSSECLRLRTLAFGFRAW